MITAEALAWFLLRGSVVVTLGYVFFVAAVRLWKIESPAMRQLTCVVILGIACCPWSVPVKMAYTCATENNAAKSASLPPLAPFDQADILDQQNLASRSISHAESQTALDAPPLHHDPRPTISSFDYQKLFVASTLLLWPLGLLACLLLGALRYFAFSYQVRTASLSNEQHAWQAQWRALLHEHGVKAKVPFFASEKHGPMLALLMQGYRLIVPQSYWQSLSLAERRGILLHELAHYLRGDILSSCLIRWLAWPFWFHPLAWRIVAEFEEAAEWACDRAVLQRGEPLAYAKALERLVDSHLPNFSLAMGRCAQSHPLVTRVRRVLNPVSNEDSLMKNFLFSAVLGGVALLALVNIRLVAQDQADANLQKVLEDAKRIEAKLSNLKDAAEKTKAVAQELKGRVDQHIDKVKALAMSPDLSADGKRRLELAQSGDEAKQLEALEGADKLGDEGLIPCAFLAKKADSEKVRRKALSIACAAGEPGLSVLSFAMETLSTSDRLFVIEQLAKQENETNRIVLARLGQSENEEISAAAIMAGIQFKDPLAFLAIVGEKNANIVGIVFDKLSTFSTDDQITLLFVSAKNGPEENLPKTIQAAGKLKSQGYPVIAAAYKRNTPEARAEIVRLFRKSTEPVEQRVVQEALKDGDATLREAAEKANAE